MAVTTLYKFYLRGGNSGLYKSTSLHIGKVGKYCPVKCYLRRGNSCLYCPLFTFLPLGKCSKSCPVYRYLLGGTVTHAYNNVCQLFNNIKLAKLLYSFLLLGNGVQ